MVICALGLEGHHHARSHVWNVDGDDSYGVSGRRHRQANYRLPYCKLFIDERPVRSPSEALHAGMREGIIYGIVFMVHTPGRQCADIPAGVTIGQEIRVVIRYIERRPSRMHEPFASLALEALHDAWPCR
jgi:hypothetical protein